MLSLFFRFTGIKCLRMTCFLSSLNISQKPSCSGAINLGRLLNTYNFVKRLRWLILLQFALVYLRNCINSCSPTGQDRPHSHFKFNPHKMINYVRESLFRWEWYTTDVNLCKRLLMETILIAKNYLAVFSLAFNILIQQSADTARYSPTVKCVLLLLLAPHKRQLILRNNFK